MATLTVTTLDDEEFDGGNLGDETTDGAGLSLREALALAQDNDTITFDNSLSGGSLNLSATELTITQDDILIDGDLDNDGDADITIASNSAGGASFVISNGSEADPRDVTLSGLALAGGYEGTSGVYASADTNVTIEDSTFTSFEDSAVFVDSGSTLHVSNSYFGNNSNAATNGGAIFGSAGSTVVVEDSTFRLNYSYVSGGAIASNGDVSVSNSVFEGNSSAQHGAAIAHISGGSLELISSTFDTNIAGGFAGAVFGTGGQSYIYNSTFSDNSAGLSGGGVYLGLGAVGAEIVNSTFYSNFATQSGGGVATDTAGTNIINSTFTGNAAGTSGGGVRNTGVAIVGNSIVAANRLNGPGATSEIDSAGGATTYSGVNIFTNQPGGVGDAQDILVTDITTVFASTVSQEGNVYGALADNGGSVETVAILNTGVAVNAGNNGLLPADAFDLDGDMNTGETLPIDARGASRVVGGNVDIGAVEVAEIVGTNNPDILNGTENADTILALGGGDDVSGLGGNDTISGGFGDDTLNGGAGDDTIGGDAGRDSIIGGAGADTLHGFGSHDTLLGGDGNDDLRGGFGRDLIGGSGGNDVGRGFEGDDRLFGGGGSDTLLGNDGDDSLTGGGGVDRLRGDAGDDTLNGRFGDDSVTGGAGDDLFQFRQGHANDVYDDFTAGAGTDDVIQLVAFGAAFDTFAEVIAAASDNGNHTTIDFGGGDSILLLNVTVADLHEDDFIFT